MRRSEFNDDTESRQQCPLLETRLLSCLRQWRLNPDVTLDSGRTLESKIRGVLEFYICECIQYGPNQLGRWWSDGLIHLEITETGPEQFNLLGVTWIDCLGIAPFEIDVVIDPEDEVYFAKTIFRIGVLDHFGQPSVCNSRLAPTYVLENRPQRNRDWAIAIELTPPAEQS